MKTLFSSNLLDALRGIFYDCNDLFFTHPLFVVPEVPIVLLYYCRALLYGLIIKKNYIYKTLCWRDYISVETLEMDAFTTKL